MSVANPETNGLKNIKNNNNNTTVIASRIIPIIET